jgi:hypothetical protein
MPATGPYHSQRSLARHIAAQAIVGLSAAWTLPGYRGKSTERRSAGRRRCRAASRCRCSCEETPK